MLKHSSTWVGAMRKARAWKRTTSRLLKAADQGESNAQLTLGYCYDQGRGVGQDYKTALSWYRKAAEQGYDKAQYNIGVFYDNGTGVSKDIDKAVEWYRKAAAQGHEGTKKRLRELGRD